MNENQQSNPNPAAETPTPETGAKAANVHHFLRNGTEFVVDADFARDLERRLAEKQARLVEVITINQEQGELLAAEQARGDSLDAQLLGICELLDCMTLSEPVICYIKLLKEHSDIYLEIRQRFNIPEGEGVIRYIEAAESRAAEMERDALRYRWLRSFNSTAFHVMHVYGPMGEAEELAGSAMDSAIDIARSAPKESEGG